MTNDNSIFRINKNKQSPATDSKPNRQPFMKDGILAREGGDEYSFALWPFKDKHGKIGYSGELTPATVKAAALAYLAQAEPIEVRPDITIAMHKIVLFENDKTIPPDADEAQKAKILRRPNYYGFSYTADGVNEHAVWDVNGTLRGSTKPWTPYEKPTAETEAERPTSSAKAGVKQAHTAKR